MSRISNPIAGRMSVVSIRQSLQGISHALKARNLPIAARLKLIEHQATLMDELRQVEIARRKLKAERQAKSQGKLEKAAEPKPFSES